MRDVRDGSVESALFSSSAVRSGTKNIVAAFFQVASFLQLSAPVVVVVVVVVVAAAAAAAAATIYI